MAPHQQLQFFPARGWETTIKACLSDRCSCQVEGAGVIIHHFKEEEESHEESLRNREK
jgi:hypothetical protein